MDPEALKREAALAACRHVRPGMVLGLGTGSTVQYVLEELARRQREGEAAFLGVATSVRTQRECERLGIRLTTLDEHPSLELTIDGADELTRDLHLIKGGGGALLREKVVAAASDRFIVVADHRKLVDVLGTTFPVPVEAVPLAVTPVAQRLRELGAEPITRRDKEGAVYVTDNGNHILDARFPRIPDPPRMERDIKMIPGVAEVGIFCGLADRAFVATAEGVQEIPENRAHKAL